jgi:hypothetical protein
MIRDRYGRRSGRAPDGSVELRLYDREDRTRAELAGRGERRRESHAARSRGRCALVPRRQYGGRHATPPPRHRRGEPARRERQPRALLGLDEHSGRASLSYADVDGGCCVLLTEDASGGRLHLFQCDGTGRRIPAGDPADPENGADVTRPKPSIPAARRSTPAEGLALAACRAARRPECSHRNAGRPARDASIRGSNGRARAGSPRAGICGQGPRDRPLGPRRSAACASECSLVGVRISRNLRASA